MGQRSLPALACALALCHGLSTRVGAAAQSAQPLTRAAAQPVIDGRLDDAAWQATPTLTNFMLYNKEQNASARTEAQVCYDNDALYVAFACHEPNTAALKADASRMDKGVCGDDCVELFVCPGSENHYFHFVVNSRNVVLDQRSRVHPRLLDTAWDGDWTWATKITQDEKWVVEIAVPWHNFAGFIGEREWSMQFCRARRVGTPEYSALTYCEGDFHNVKAFTQFAAPQVDLEPYTGLQPVSLGVAGGYEVTPTGYAYRPIGAFKSQRDRVLTLVLEDQPADGEPTRITQPLSMSKAQEASFKARMPIKKLGERKVKLWLREASGKPVYVTAIDSSRFPKLFRGFLDRSYYTTERKGFGLFELNVPPGGAALIAELEVRPTGRKPIQEQAPVRTPHSTLVPFDLTLVPLGRHPATLTVRNRTGGVVASVNRTLIKHEAAPEDVREVKIDRDRRVLLLDGKPYFMVGIMGVPAEHLKECAAAGFNLSMRWGGAAGSSRILEILRDPVKLRARLDPYLNALHEAGMYTLELPWKLTPYDLHYAEGKFNRNVRPFVEDALIPFVNAVRSHPNVIGYYGPDEPSEPYRDGVKLCCDTVRDLDPYHPNLVLFCQTTPEWTDVFDYAARDIYPRVNTPFFTLYDTGIVCAERCHKWGVPYILTPLVETSSARPYGLRPEDQIAQNYIGIVTGAKGILWWVWPPRHHDNWQAMKQVAGELNALSPVLTSRTPPQQVVYNPQAMRDTVKALVKTHEGKTWIIAVNSSRTLASVRLGLPEPFRGEAGVQFESREVAIRDRVLEDRFAGHERHVYVLDGAWPDYGTLTLGVTLDESKTAKQTDQPEDAPKDAVPVNLVLDPGFEDGRFWHFTKRHPDDDANRVGAESERGKGRVACLEASDPKKGVTASSWPVRLEPNARYVFGGYAKCVGGKVVMRLQDTALSAEGEYLTKETQITPRDRAGWGLYKTTVVTRDTPVMARAVLQVTGTGNAWFDDIFLHTRDRPLLNVVRNASMERDLPGLPGWIEGWTPRKVAEPGFINKPGSPWAADSTIAHHGERSLKLVRRAPTSTSTVLSTGATGASASVAGLTPGTYVLSFYAKADQPKLEIGAIVGWGNTKYTRHVVNADWQRYSMTFPIKKRARDFVWIGLLDPGTVWLDAVQVEKGGTPTPFAEGE